MFIVKTFSASAAAALALSGCAGWTTAEPHQHLRDAKQGPTLPAPTAYAATPKPLHDHRDFK
jgi:hypothetical protein